VWFPSTVLVDRRLGDRIGDDHRSIGNPAGHDDSELNQRNAAENPVSIALSPANSSPPPNTAQQFSATGSHSDGSSRDLTAPWWCGIRPRRPGHA